uniref:Enoyl-CoA delta isomerase 1 n=2 Tax=Photinus pyralis TaxID=7054 RepID=A0A1Y1MBQ4_PHOPY
MMATSLPTVNLNRPPLNVLNLEFVTEFSNVLRGLERDMCPGVVFTSSSDQVFSFGFEISELCDPEPMRFRSFYTVAQNRWMQLYGSSFPTVALINGSAMATGCLLALSCDYRVMVKGHVIGLNEQQVGLVPPTWFTSTMLNTIGHRHTEMGVRLEEGMQEALKFLDKFKNITPKCYAYGKNSLRAPYIKRLKNNQEEDLNVAYEFLKDPVVTEKLKALKTGTLRDIPAVN